MRYILFTILALAFLLLTGCKQNVTYPTDAKLHKKIVGTILKIAKNLNLHNKQNQRNPSMREGFTEICFLRDDELI